MMPIKDNQDVASFLVTKHSWKGRYKRVFSVGTHGITTYNPDRLEVTNRWLYCDIITLASGKHSGNSANNHDFVLVMRKDKKVDSMKFSSEHKCIIMTEAFKYRHLFAEKPKEILRYQAYKHHWSDTRLPIVLEVTPCSLDQLDPATNTVLASYNYHDIEGIIGVQDYPGGFVIACGGFSRLHLFAASNFAEIRNKILEWSNTTLNLTIKVLTTTITTEDFQNQRFGKYSEDLHQTSVSEFTVHKVNNARHMEPPRRILCLSDTCLLERDPENYSICCLRPLKDIWALIRHPSNPQMFQIEYLNGHTRSYLATERDALLASLMDGVRSAGNRDVHVKMQATPRGKRFGPLHTPVDEETESNHLRLFQNPGQLSRAEVIERFNANVAYSGLLYSVSQERLFSENKEKLICSALSAVTSCAPSPQQPLLELEALFHALRRLCASKVGFAAFTSLPGFREWLGTSVVNALRRADAASSHAALDAACALLHPMHADADLRQEQTNKASMLASAQFLEGLLDMWSEHVAQGSGALVVAAMLDFLTFALCVPYSETTDGKHFDQLLEMVAIRGRSLFRLFEHPSMAIVKGAGLVMRAIIEEGSGPVGAKMQSLALGEAALPRHLLLALYGGGEAGRHRLAQRHLSRHLVGLWVTGHPPAMGLLKRILPSGLLSFLDSLETVPAAAIAAEHVEERDNLLLASASERRTHNAQWIAVERQLKYVEKHLEHYTQMALQHWAAHTGMTVERKEKMKERPIVLRKRREKIKAEANWPYFCYQFTRDHALPNLIWNHKTREELRNALENELRAFNADRDLSSNTLIAWNHTELEVHYACLQDEVKIGDYYLRLLLEAKEEEDNPIRRSYEFFNDLYHRVLLTPKPEMKCMCLQAMAIVYSKHYEDIGPFSDTKYVVQMLERTTDRTERDRLVIFLDALMNHRRNVRSLLEWGGVRILLDLATLAHLHTARATAPAQSNVLEAGGGGQVGQTNDKEWYYNVETSQKVTRVGPVSFQQMKELYADGTINNKTRCWANSMDGWRALAAVPQLKWSIVARGDAVLDESRLALQVLNLLIKCCHYFPSRDEDNAIIRPLPKIKRMLSEPVVLAHVVQLLLTFDTILVEKVATLLHEIMQDNPEVSKLYMTGVFYFILMYNGSNILPIARFLQLTHMKQAFRADDNSSSDIMQRSILGQLLPEAMVCYLHNHGADKFAQIFLGEYDTPEAIWNSEMRKMLIMKVCAHIGEFTPRLRAHVGARYPYLAVPAVRYPQLERELFCNIFYLRHLCDIQRFPDWPIPDPVKLLKDVLEAWRREVERKPPAMTVEEAYKALGLAAAKHHEEGAVRKAYYRLAQQYHPDKNPEGRDRFESVNQAYEFLCSRSVWTSDGPNSNNIVLVLRTQTILFNRYTEELSPYKYAGYPQLLSTVRLETGAERLFAGSESPALLPAACELAHATVRCSALNAEELCREGGLEVLHEAFARCVSVLGQATKEQDLSASVCTHICRCFSVASQFASCRSAMAAMVGLVDNLVRILQFRHLGALCTGAAAACGGLAANEDARASLACAGALHALLAATLLYDYTLDEGGVVKEASANKQETANQLAKECVSACGKLGGYSGRSDSGPRDAAIARALQRLLTPYLCNKLQHDKPEELLKILTSNWRTPYLIWDNSTRAEMTDFLESRKKNLMEEEDEEIVNPDFRYSAHEGLLVIGNIFVQIYNEQPTFPIENPKGFTLDLLEFLNHSAQQPNSQERMEQMVMALTALANVITKNAGVEIQCIGHFGLLFGLLSARGNPQVQKSALQVVVSVTCSKECVEDVAASCVLGHLLALIPLLPDEHLTVMRALTALITNTKLVKEALNKGAVIYLLDLFCNSKVQETREAAAELLARLMTDKLHGPKVKLTMSRHLPPVFADAMREGGAAGGAGVAAAAHMFDSTHEHPELVWDEHSRRRSQASIADMKEQHFTNQWRDPHAVWTYEERARGSICEAWAPAGEVVVSGVYLRLFIANPHWAVRNPNQFLADLLEETITHLSKDKGESEESSLRARALSALLSARPTLAEHAARLGHVPRVARLLPVAPLYAVPLLRSLSDSSMCVSALSSTDCIRGLQAAMRAERECIGSACEALSRMFCSSANTDQLVVQALESDMIGYLLSLLEHGLESGPEGGQTKAQLVAALKAMCRSALHGERVRACLGKSAVWEQYAAQRHDLFISDRPIGGYLTGGVPQTAGYLAAPPTNITLQPPPMD